MLDGEALIKMALESSASGAAILETSTIKFYDEVRKACEKNICRKYDTNWMGPPGIGPISELSRRVREYRHGLLFQTVHQLASSFDFKGMMAAAGIQAAVCKNLLGNMRDAYPTEDFLALNAGCCGVCEKCAYLETQPCRHPDQALSSVEAYGMIVVELQKSVGLPYNNGKNTVTYVGMILFDRS
jgi:predicted metal-binding protein